MSHYTVTVKEINVLGGIWWPYGAVCAQNITLRDYDIENIKARSENGELTRDAISDWLDCNAGDFSSIEDFRADIGDFLSDWQNEESEGKFFDAMYPEA